MGKIRDMANFFLKNKFFSVKVILILILAVFVVIWRFYCVDVMSGLSSNFYNETKVFTVKKNYDASTGEYYGPEELDSAVVFKASGLDGNKLTMDGSFVSKNKEGQEIFYAEREYTVDRRTYEFDPDGEGNDTKAYLFTPKTNGKSDFVYWSLIYDTAIDMKYQDESEILGVKVSHYSASFTADVTKNLTKFSGVGDGKGLVTDVDLDIWVNSNSGIMIDYNDTANFYSYNLETGERVSPWGTWSTNYTLDSIGKHVDLAKQLESRIFFMTTVIPSIVGVVIVVLIAWSVYDLKRIRARNQEAFSENVE